MYMLLNYWQMFKYIRAADDIFDITRNLPYWLWDHIRLLYNQENKKFEVLSQWKYQVTTNFFLKFNISGQICLHWAEANLKGVAEFQNKKSRPLFTIIFKSKIVITRLKILVHYGGRSVKPLGEIWIICSFQTFFFFFFLKLNNFFFQQKNPLFKKVLKSLLDTYSGPKLCFGSRKVVWNRWGPLRTH